MEEMTGLVNLRFSKSDENANPVMLEDGRVYSLFMTTDASGRVKAVITGECGWAPWEDPLTVVYKDRHAFDASWKKCDPGTPSDVVEHPEHYTQRGMECIEWIEAALTPEEFRGYLKGNILKYFWRHESKGKPQQDLDKMDWYRRKLKEAEGHDDRA